MKLSTCAVPLSGTIIICVLAGIAIASPLLFPDAKTASPSDRAHAKNLSDPALNDKFISRIEDQGTSTAISHKK